MESGKRATFRCNICGSPCPTPVHRCERDLASCPVCGSNARWRAVVHVLSTELFGESLPLAAFPMRPDIVGIGMSDWPGYAVPLAQKMRYTNTFLHTEPLLDVTQPGDEAKDMDFAAFRAMQDAVTPAEEPPDPDRAAATTAAIDAMVRFG
jgi:hypothetical protein